MALASSESLSLELLGAFTFGFPTTAAGDFAGGAGLAATGAFFLLSSDESEEEELAGLPFLAALEGVTTVGARLEHVD